MRTFALIACLVPAVATGEPRPDDPKPVIAAAQAKLAKYRTVQYTSLDRGVLVEDAGVLESRVTSPVIAARVGGRIRLRVEQSDVSSYHCKRAGCPEGTSGDTSIGTFVYDGRVFHQYNDADGSKSVTRSTTDRVPMFTLLEIGDLFATGDAVPVTVIRAPDVVIGGKTLHVLVRTVGSNTVQLYYLERDTGLLHTEVGITGPSLSVRTYTEMRINAPIPPSTFVFVPPPDVAVSDLDVRR